MVIGPGLRAEIEAVFQIIPDRSTDSELVFLCPECGDTSGNRSVNLENGMTNCWRCDKGTSGRGSFLGWAKAMGFEFSGRAVMVADGWKETLRQLNSRATFNAEDHVEVRLPDGFTLLKEKPASGYSTLIAEMAERKHLTFDDLANANAGYTSEDDYWEPYCIFPVLEHSKVVYYQGRTYVDIPGESTKRFPSRKYVPFGAKYWVYGLDVVYKRKAPIVIVVESILNVLSLRRKLRQEGVRDVVPVCVFKHAISVPQMMKIRRAGVQEVCVLFDRDAVDKSWAAGSASDVRLSVAEMPERPGQEKLDANDDVDAAYEAFLNRERVTYAKKTLRSLSARSESRFRIPRDFKGCSKKP